MDLSTRAGPRRCWADMCSDSDDDGIADLTPLAKVHSGSKYGHGAFRAASGRKQGSGDQVTPTHSWTPRLPKSLTESPRTENQDFGGRWSKRKRNWGEKKWQARQSTHSTIDTIAPSSPVWTETETDGSNSAGSSSRAVKTDKHARMAQLEKEIACAGEVKTDKRRVQLEKDIASLQKQVADMKKDAQKARNALHETKDALQKIIDEERSRNVDQNTRWLLEMDNAAQVLERTKAQYALDHENWGSEKQRLLGEIKAAELRVECEMVQHRNSQFEYECRIKADAAAKTREAVDAERLRFEGETRELRENAEHYCSTLKEVRKDHNTYVQKMQAKLDSALARCLRAEKNAKQIGKDIGTQTPTKSSNEERLQEVNRKVVQRLAEVNQEKKELLERFERLSVKPREERGHHLRLIAVSALADSHGQFTQCPW